MKAIELFAGVGGFRLGLEYNGIEVIWANEFNNFAAQTYNKNFAKKGELVDERSITDIDVSEIPEHDLLVGGFPCQAFSNAGKRGGFNDTRGTLFFDIARILKHKRPRYFLLENVKGLLSHDTGKTFATILRVLADIGYECQWHLLDSKSFGVPQHRERIYIAGHLREETRPQIFSFSQASTEAFNEHSKNRNVARTVTSTYQKGNKGSHILLDVSYPSRVRQYDTVAPTIRDYGSGGNKMPMVAVREATKSGFAIAGIGDGINLGAANSGTRRGRVSKNSAKTLNTSSDQGVYDGKEIRRLTPLECERLQGFPDGWTEGVSDSQRYKQMGNAVTVNVISYLAKGFVS